VRVAAWVFLLCTLLAGVGLALPSLEVTARATVLGKPPSVSMLRLGTSRATVRRIATAYRQSSVRDAATALVASMGGRLAGRAVTSVADARSAFADVDRLVTQDADGVSLAVVIAVWVTLGLLVAMGLLGLGVVVGGGATRGRAGLMLACAVPVAIVGIGALIGARLAVVEVRAAIGLDVVGVGAGAYLTAVCGVGALVAAIALLVLTWRAIRRVAPAQLA